MSQRPRSFKKFQLQVERTVDIVNFDHAVSLALLAMVCPKPLSLFQMQEHKEGALKEKPPLSGKESVLASKSSMSRSAFGGLLFWSLLDALGGLRSQRRR